MSALAHVEGLQQFEARAPHPRPAPIPDSRLNLFFEGELAGIERRTPAAASTSSAASSAFSCGPHNTSSYCEKPVDGSSNTTIPIVLGVVIPITVASVIFAFLHRRHVKKLRQEDANDAHKSLDFGIMEPERRKGKSKSKKGGPEMSMADTKETARRGRGLSMDLSEGNPYLLPAGLQQSRDSLHSLSRAIASEDDRYARATSYVPNDGTGSYASSLRRGPDDASSFTGSSRRTGFTDADSSHNLIRQAHRMSSSGASATPPPYPTQGQSQKGLAKPFSPPVRNGSLAPAGAEHVRDSFVSTASSNGANTALRASNNYLGAFIRGGFLTADEQKEKREQQPSMIDAPKAVEPSKPPSNVEQLTQPQNADQSPEAAGSTPVTSAVSASHNEERKPPSHDEGLYAENADVHRATPDLQPVLRHAFTLPEISIGEGPDLCQEPTLPQFDHPAEQEFDHDPGYDSRRNTADIRPLPPDDPSENPEQRANRIRSFYKEYFEETKPGSKANHQSYYDGSEDYVADNYPYQQGHDQGYDQGYEQGYDPAYDDYYDPSQDPYYQYDQNQYPTGEDYSRSMTPPPRGPPRFMGTTHRPRSMSSGSYIPERSHVYSSASGRGSSAMGGMPAKKKNLPPPKPLHVLPTPHMLKDDIILPIDFAPPSRSKQSRAGTPDSLKGGLRPYSPAVPAHLPLMSSFDELAPMPSP